MNNFRVRYWKNSAQLETVEIKARSFREVLQIACFTHDINESRIFSINIIN